MQTTREHGKFDDLAEAYERFRTGYSSTLYNALFTLGFRAGARILDIACGTGIATAQFVARGCEVTGVDSSPPMLALAEKNLPMVKFHEGRAEQLPFEDGVFDGAICAQAFHWFDQPAAFAELIRVVKPDSPIAIWWKMLSTTDRMRTLRERASPDPSITVPEALSGGFRAFYAAPLRSRALRVIPHTVRTDGQQWLGYERSRARAQNYGSKVEAYFEALERELRAAYGSLTVPFDVQYMQYLYVGYP